MAAANTIVLTNANYLDVSTLEVKVDATIVMQNGLMKELIDNGSNAQGSGRYLLSNNSKFNELLLF